MIRFHFKLLMRNRNGLIHFHTKYHKYKYLIDKFAKNLPQIKLVAQINLKITISNTRRF